MRRVRAARPVVDAAKTFAESIVDPAADRRERDRELLREIDRHGGLRDAERDAFEDMADRLDRGAQRELTIAQREWVEGVADRKGFVVGDPAERNANVPRGRETEAPSVLSAAGLRRALAARSGGRRREEPAERISDEEDGLGHEDPGHFPRG